MSNLNEFLTGLQRQPWRPGTTAVAVMAVALFVFGLLEASATWARVSCCIGGGLLALWVNAMEMATPIKKAIAKATT